MTLYSRHHICPTSRGGTNDPRNIAIISDKVHRAVHTLLGNSLPHESIEAILELSDSVLKDKYKEAIREVNRSGWMYQKGILRKF